MNFLAILLCAIVAMVLGTIWHSKLLFGPTYMKAIGADMNMPPEKMREIQKKMWQIFLSQFILVMFQVWVLSKFLYTTAFGISAVTNSIWIWAGFVMPTIAGITLWSARPRKMAWQIFLINSGYQFVLFILFAIILKVWM
ncbi:MAG: DUF1761 domain-containing protein [Candidatus Paceibacterota bacterium]